MFVLRANRNHLHVLQREMLTSGSRGVFICRFELEEGWEGRDVTVVFQAGKKPVNVIPDGDTCEIPWEVLELPVTALMCGVQGTDNGTLLPTVWADLGPVFPGARRGAEPNPPPTDVYAQILKKANEAAQLAGEVHDSWEKGELKGDNGKSPYIGGDGYWYVYVDATGEYEKTDTLAGGSSQGPGIVTETDPTVPDWAKAANPPTYTAQQVGADPAGTAATAVSSHNVSPNAHNDIRLVVQDGFDKLSGEIENLSGDVPDYWQSHIDSRV